jgi:hypothetical protein
VPSETQAKQTKKSSFHAFSFPSTSSRLVDLVTGEMRNSLQKNRRKNQQTKGKEEKCQGDQTKMNEMRKERRCCTLVLLARFSGFACWTLEMMNRVRKKMMPNPFDVFVRWRVF